MQFWAKKDSNKTIQEEKRPVGAAALRAMKNQMRALKIRFGGWATNCGFVMCSAPSQLFLSGHIVELRKHKSEIAALRQEQTYARSRELSPNDGA